MNFSQAMEVAKSIDEMANALKAQLCADIAELPLSGRYINDGRQGGALMAVVPFSALNDNWSPEYHLPPAQARLVAKRLAKYESAATIISAVDFMLTNGCVRFENGDRVYLNDRTYKTILDSELGQHIAKETEKALLRFFTEYAILHISTREKGSSAITDRR